MDRKALIRQYKQTPRPAGVFAVINNTTGKRLIGSSPDLPGMLNRQRFQLEMGSHPDSELQGDWNELGPGAFEFVVLDELEPSDDPGSNLSEDLATVHAMWLERLGESEFELYPTSRRGT